MYQAFVRLLLFATPIFSVHLVFGKRVTQTIVWLNPLAHMVSFSRSLILSGEFFPLRQVLIFLVVNLVLLYGSLKLFRRYEPAFAEYL